MKFISKSDLLIILPLIADRDSFFLDDFEKILDRFGDEGFIGSYGVFCRTFENPEMAQIRKELSSNVEVPEKS